MSFEGNYSNGLRKGKGKEFYKNDKVSFEGNYSDGLRNGNGKEIALDGSVIFEGEYMDGIRVQGKSYEYGVTIKEFVGEFLDIKPFNGTLTEYDLETRRIISIEIIKSGKTIERKENI